MSDDLMSRMRAAAEQASAAAETARSEASAASRAETEALVSEVNEARQVVDEPAEAEPVAEAAAEAEAPAEEAVEAAAEETEEKPAADLADELIEVRRQADRRIRQAESRAQKLEQELQAAKAESEKSRQQLVDDLFRKLRRAPAKTFEEYGYKFQELIEAGMREGEGRDSPFHDEVEELKREVLAMRREREEQAKQRETQAAREREEGIRRNFYSQVTEKDAPTLFAIFSGNPKALYDEALTVAQAYVQKHGEPPNTTSVVQFLEKKYRERLGSMTTASATQAAPKAEPAKKAPVPKTLTTKAASETRSTGKSFGELSRDEGRDLLMKAVERASSRAPN